MSIDTKEFLARQRRRLAGGILGHVERAPWYGTLSAAQKGELRDKVLSAIGNYHDAVLDVLGALGATEGVTNEIALKMIQEIHEAVGQLRERELDSERTFAVHAGGRAVP